MSTSTSPTVLLPSLPESRYGALSNSGPVLAVLLEGAPLDGLLERAGALARARGTAVHPVLLQARLPLTTDPALIDRLVRRRRRDLDRVQQALASCPPLGASPQSGLLLLSVPPLPQGARRAWRDVESVARHRSAAVVVIPPVLATVAAGRAGRDVELAVAVVGGAR